MEKNKKGFTLIELMIVITTIALISALAYAAFDAGRRKPRDTKRVSDIKAIQTALALYATNSSSGFPAAPSVALGQQAASRLCDTGWQSTAAPCSGKTYLETVPSAPIVPDGSCSAAENAYAYAQTGAGTGYTLRFCLGTDVTEYKAGVVTVTQDGVK
jgi:prepilin-type N-terminal cleavage/methylation domain-containing protein